MDKWKKIGNGGSDTITNSRKYIKSWTYFLSLNSRDFSGPGMYDYHLIVFQKSPQSNFTSNQPIRKPRKRWEDVVKDDAASLLQCRNWRLTVQNTNVWRQKLWEARAQI
jgi:hypothetical protein